MVFEIIAVRHRHPCSPFEDSLVEFSAAYADQNEREHAALLVAIRTRRVDAIMDL
jgi:hypothetical protein